MGKRQRTGKSFTIIRELEADGGIDMDYVRAVAEEDGRTPFNFLKSWVMERYPVGEKSAGTIAHYFIDKEEGNRRRNRKGNHNAWTHLYPLPKDTPRIKSIDKRLHPADGWYTVCFHQCYVKDTKIIYGISPYDGSTVYPYRLKNGEWVLDQETTLNGFRQAVRKKTMALRP